MTSRARPDGAQRPTWTARPFLVAICIAVLGAILALPTSAGAVPVPWRNCGAVGDALSLQRFDASVWPPQAGEPLTLSYRMTLAEELTGPSFEYVTVTSSSGDSAHWMPFQLPIAQLFAFGLRGHSAAPGRQLPLPAGPYGRSLTVRVPRGIPSGTTVGVDLTAYDASGHEVVCMQLTIPVK